MPFLLIKIFSTAICLNFVLPFNHGTLTNADFKNSSVSLVKRLGNLLKSPRFLAALGLLPVAAGPALALLAGFPLAALTGPAVLP